MTDEEFDKALNAQQWTFAKTYAKTAPHEYFLRTANPDLFGELKRRIAEMGVEKLFYKTKVMYYFHKGHKYWGYDLIMNRDDASKEYK